jgi:hypothetical protein
MCFVQNFYPLNGVEMKKDFAFFLSSRHLGDRLSYGSAEYDSLSFRKPYSGRLMRDRREHSFKTV